MAEGKTYYDKMSEKMLQEKGIKETLASLEEYPLIKALTILQLPVKRCINDLNERLENLEKRWER